MSETADIQPAAVAHPTTDWTGVAMVIVGAFCFSLAIPFVRWTDGLGSNAIAFFRALFGFLFLCTLLLRTREPLRWRAYRRDIPRLVVLGLCVAATVTLYTYSIRHTTAAVAALLVNSAPLYVAVLGPLLLHEPRPHRTALSLALAVVGIVLVSDPAQLRVGSASLSGLLAAALSGLTYSFVLIMGRALRGRVGGLTQTLWSDGITALVLLPWALRAPLDTVIANLDTLIPVGIFSLGLSYLLYFLSLERVRAQVVSMVALFEPVSGVLLAMAFFAEVPNALGWLGGALVIASIYLIVRE
jgi:drug/metabolite transporter (DMT)-like permease